MITTVDEYLGALFKINDKINIPTLATLLPRSEYIYNIDLDSRTIEAPEFLSVVDDHVAETIYFLVDRFFDNVDLSTTGCIIQYINAKGEYRIYQVPFYDIETYHNDDKMLIPWCIEGEATKAAGNITFSIRFFDVDKTGQYLLFNLNTLPATSSIKSGLKIIDGYIHIGLTKEEFEAGKYHYYYRDDQGNYIRAISYDENMRYYALANNYDYNATTMENLLSQMSKLNRENILYWKDVTEHSRLDG